MIPANKIEACIKAFYGSGEETTYGKIQAVLTAYESMGEDPEYWREMWRAANTGRIEAEAKLEAVAAQADTTPAAHGVGDRAALEYLMQQFEAETWECRICGHSEPTNDCDSAIYLLEYLQAASAPGAE